MAGQSGSIKKPGKPTHEKRAIEALRRVNHFISYVTDLHKLLELIMRESKKVLNAASSSLMLYDPERNDLYFEIALGKKSERIKNVIRLDLNQGIAGHAARKRQTIIVNDAQHDKRLFRQADKISSFKTQNLIAAPMVRGENLIGVLEVLNKNEGDFTDEDSDILKIIADSAAIAIENARLIEANVRAERLAAMGQAVAGISHYVKNILAGTTGSMSLVEMGLKNQNIEVLQRVWPILSRSTKKINDLVQDMLTYSKHRKLQLETGELHKLVEEVIELCAQNAQEQRVTLKSLLCKESPRCRMDYSSLQDAVLNLVGNAIEAGAQFEEGRVSLSTSVVPDAQEVRLDVKDNGPGIPEEILSKIFDPFFSTKGSKGTGLGLAVTRKVVEEHGGRMSVDSTPGKGTTFTISLPLHTR